MNNSDLAYTEDTRRALQDSSPGPQVIQPTRAPASQQVEQTLSRQPATVMAPNLGLSSFLPGDTTQYPFASPLGNDVSRLQQFHQFSMAPTSMIPQPTQQTSLQQHQPQQQLTTQQTVQQPQQQQVQTMPQANNDLLRTLMTQKMPVAMPTYEDQLRTRLLTAPAEPLLQPPLLDEARFLMAQGNGLHFSSLNRPPLTLPSPHELTLRDDTRRMRGGVIEPFPEKLHRLLTEVEAAGRSDVISFIANGKAFAIHKPDKFFKEIVPKYFRQSRLSSFKRQLNLYGFELINTGPARGGYFHEMFIKERPELCRRMRRIAVKLQTKPQQEGDKQKTNPDFYNMAPVAKDTDNTTEKEPATSSSVDNGDGEAKDVAADAS